MVEVSDWKVSSSPKRSSSKKRFGSPRHESSTSNTCSSSSHESRRRLSPPSTEDGPAPQTAPMTSRSHRSMDSADRNDDTTPSSPEPSPPKPPKVYEQDDDDEEEEDSQNPYYGHVPFTNRMIDRYQSFRYQCGKAVNNKRLQLFIVTLIAINAIMLGVATFDFVREDPPVADAFELVDKIFLIVFTIELGLQFIYHGWRILTDGWLVFDLVIIVTSWSFESVQIVRAFRIFRALRLITRIKVMKNLVLALFGVMPRMFAIALLLLVVSYIFAVMFTQLFKDLFTDGLTAEDYFGRLDDTFFTLFQIMTLDNWADIARQVMVVYSWAWLPFVVFVIVTGFVVVNLIIAVICDAISALHDDEKAKLHGSYEEEVDDEDDESYDTDPSVQPGLQEDVREQLDSLESHVEELTRTQDETLLLLQKLSQTIQQRQSRKKR